MNNEETSKENSKGITRILKIIFSIIVGIVAGPLELLWTGFLVKDKNSQILWLIGGILSFSIVYLIVLFIVNNLFHRKDYDGDKCWLIARVLAPISILITWFIIGKYNGDGNVSSVFLALFLMIPNIFFFVSAGSGSNATNKKIKATTWNFGKYKETTFTDETGKKVGEVSSFDWGPVTDTTIKDKNGNRTKIEHWKL